MISLSAGKIKGRNDSACGFKGVILIAFTSVCTMLPPADMLYAVDPVGVAKMIPLAETLVKYAEFRYRSTVNIELKFPASSVISFSAFKTDPQGSSLLPDEKMLDWTSIAFLHSPGLTVMQIRSLYFKYGVVFSSSWVLGELSSLIAVFLSPYTRQISRISS